MNIELLERTKASIMDNQFNMCFWSHCVAGHACRVSGDVINREDMIVSTGQHVKPRAAGLLGLEPDQKDRLFAISKWPVQFHMDKHTYDTWSDHPVVTDKENAIRRIDFFIATNGTDIEQPVTKVVEDRELVLA